MWSPICDYMKLNKDVKKCSNCGSTKGYYKYTPVFGNIVTFYNSDGTYAENNDSMFDCLRYKEEQKTMFCSSCHKRIKNK